MTGNRQHAEIGTLAAVGYDNQRIVVEYPRDMSEYLATTAPSYTSYATNPTTLVQGLGEKMDVKDLSSDDLNRIVIVTFKPGDEQPMAESITFPLATRIRATHGTVRSVDNAEHRLTLETPNGRDESFALDEGFGAQIDSNEGLLEVSDLQKGQQVIVYYAGPESVADAGDMAGNAYLIYKRS